MESNKYIYIYNYFVFLLIVLLSYRITYIRAHDKKSKNADVGRIF